MTTLSIGTPRGTLVSVVSATASGLRSAIFSRKAAAPAPRCKKGTDMLSHLIHRFRAWRRDETSLRELSRLSDRELADIGIVRSDTPRIPRLARESARIF